jgi:hypothetical protein
MDTIEKELIIARAIPGSGKTTWINENRPDSWVCSADHYWLKPIPEGVDTSLIINPIEMFDEQPHEYIFRPELLGKAHAWCFSKFLSGIEHNEPSIVIDNTNIEYNEFQNYLHVGKLHGYTLKLVQFPPRTMEQIATCYARNTHKVPLPVVLMKAYLYKIMDSSKFQMDFGFYDQVEILNVEV